MKVCIRLFGVLLILATFVLSSCDGGNCVRGNRDVITEYRNIDHFNGIVSEGSWDIIYHEDSMFYTVIEAESNLLPYISTAVNGSDLVIRTRDHRCINNRKAISIHVYAPSIERLLLDGSGSIDAEEVRGTSAKIRIAGSGNLRAGVWSGHLDAEISGSGEMSLWGSVDESEMQISGSGDIRAYDLQQNTCFSTISGSGDMYLNVAEFLDVRIFGSGDVYYKGNPELHKSIDGSGNVHHTW